MGVKEGLIGASSGALTGAASGTPHGIAIGAIGGGLQGFFGGGGDNGAQSELYDKLHQRNVKFWNFTNAEGARRTHYEKQALQISKRNNEENLSYQDHVSLNNWTSGMAIRDYDFAQQNRAYEASIDAAVNQIGFSQMAANFAVKQQDRAHSEQLLSLMFDEQQTLLDYNVQTTGLGFQKDKIKLNEGKLVGTAQKETQAQRLEGMKAAGTAINTGSGRSSAKAMQAAIAEAGANQATIADELMFGLDELDLDLKDIDNKLEGMNSQLILDQTMLRATRDNVNARDSMVRDQIAFNQLNSVRQAYNSIRLKPEINPPLPLPIALPRPVYQAVYEYKPGPKPKRIDAKTGASVPQGSSASSWVPQFIQGIQTFANAAIAKNNNGGYSGNSFTNAGVSAGDLMTLGRSANHVDILTGGGSIDHGVIGFD